MTSNPAAVLLIVTLAIPAGGLADDREQHFESRVRPLLARHCIECHGPAKQEAELRLDGRDALVADREAGPAVVPSQPDKSRLLDVLRYDEFDVQMPPKGKLPAEEIASIEKWIRDGAYWPEQVTISPIAVTDPAEITRLRGEHWSFRPVEDVRAPAVAAPGSGPIDAFVRAELAARNLAPSSSADRRVLARRLSFDLVGLPPTFEMVEAFADDPAPDAYERLVERLLASQRFGERWGRYWLDVARYADTKGYVFTEDKRYPFAYTYRDFVIRSLNEDKPFDRFVREQLAADQLDLSDDPKAIAALGFLTVGRRFMNREQEIIDDRIDVVTRGLQGLTVACARCHDHKYDPVPTADYYSLYGVFDSTHEPKDLPLVGEPEQSAAYEAYVAELTKRQNAREGYVDAEVAKLLSDLRVNAADYLAALVKKSGSVPDEFYVALKPGDTRPRIVTRWERYVQRRAKPNDPVFGPWQALSALSADGFAESAGIWLAEHDGDERFNATLLTSLAEAKPKSMYDVAKTYGTVFAAVEATWQDALRTRDASTANGESGDRNAPLPDPAAEQLRQVLYGEGGPLTLSREEVRREFDRAKRDRERALQRKIDEWKATSPAAPARAMVLRDDERPTEPVVFIRGNNGRRGDRVPRRFPRIVAGLEAPSFTHGSGRLDLANAIADPTNPLTARVFVNRVWLHLFDRGLVATIDDFGLRSEPPSHPELLDHLATEFVAHDWSVKWLVREVVLSETYRQSSEDDPGKRAIDPDNRLLWRQNRKRLDFEAGRDAVLAVADRLDDVMFGRPVEITDVNADRRTIYGRVDRNNLPSLFRTFDFASPDTSTGKRPATTVPQQALFGLNSPFVLENAKSLASRAADANDPVETLYRLALARAPSTHEADLGAAFLTSQPGGTLSPLEKLAHVILLTNEFAFVD